MNPDTRVYYDPDAYADYEGDLLDILATTPRLRTAIYKPIAIVSGGNVVWGSLDELKIDHRGQLDKYIGFVYEHQQISLSGGYDFYPSTKNIKNYLGASSLSRRDYAILALEYVCKKVTYIPAQQHPEIGLTWSFNGEYYAIVDQNGSQWFVMDSRVVGVKGYHPADVVNLPGYPTPKPVKEAQWVKVLK